MCWDFCFEWFICAKQIMPGYNVTMCELAGCVHCRSRCTLHKAGVNTLLENPKIKTIWKSWSLKKGMISFLRFFCYFQQFSAKIHILLFTMIYFWLQDIPPWVQATHCYWVRCSHASASPWPGSRHSNIASGCLLASQHSLLGNSQNYDLRSKDDYFLIDFQ